MLMVNTVHCVYRKTSGPLCACCSYYLKCDLFCDFFGHFFSKDDVNFHSLIESIDTIMAFGNSICFFVRKRIFLFV